MGIAGVEAQERLDQAHHLGEIGTHVFDHGAVCRDLLLHLKIVHDLSERELLLDLHAQRVRLRCFVAQPAQRYPPHVRS